MLQEWALFHHRWIEGKCFYSTVTKKLAEMPSGLLPNTDASRLGLVVTRDDRSLLQCQFSDCLRRGSSILLRVLGFLKFIRDRLEPVLIAGCFEPLVHRFRIQTPCKISDTPRQRHISGRNESAFHVTHLRCGSPKGGTGQSVRSMGVWYANLALPARFVTDSGAA